MNYSNILFGRPNNSKPFEQEIKNGIEVQSKKDILIKKVAKCIATAFVTVLLSNGFPFRFGKEIISQTGVCPSALLPEGTTAFFNAYIHYPRLLIPDLKHPSCYFLKLWAPAFEEFVDRVIFQEYLLKRIPAKLIHKFSPDNVYLTNHIVARVVRVFTSSLFFALHHSWAHKCDKGDMYPYIMAGAIFGTMQEVSGHPLYNVIAHIGTNSIIFRCKLW